MIAIKHKGLNKLVGKMDNCGTILHEGDILCDVQMRKSYVVLQRVLDMKTGDIIGVIVNDIQE